MGKRTNLLPPPNGSETVEKADVFEQIWIQPQPRLHREHRHAEQNQAENRHGDEQADQPQHAHTQIPHPDAQLHRPQREHDDRHDGRQRACRIQFLAPLWALVQPDVVEVFVYVLLLLDFDVPETLGALLRLFCRGGRVVVAFMRVGLGDAQGKER